MFRRVSHSLSKKRLSKWKKVGSGNGFLSGEIIKEANQPTNGKPLGSFTVCITIENGKPYGEDEISKEVDRYFAAKEDNLFQTSEIGVKVVTQPVDFTSGNADTKKTMKSYQHFASAHLDFYAPKDIKQVREKVLKKYPYTQPVLDKILARTYRLQSFGKKPLTNPPTLIWGTAGSGKSTFLRMLMKELGSFTSSVNIGGDGDDHWLGLSKGFSTGHPSMVLTSLKDSNVINPSFIVDELDKQPPKKEYNNTQDKLLKLLEPSEAENWRETYTGMYLNTSHINWLFTANDIDRIGGTFKITIAGGADAAASKRRCSCLDE